MPSPSKDRLAADRAPAATSGLMIWRLTWPQLLMMIFHFFIGFADVLAAGRISSDVQAAMGMITQALFFFLVLAMALATGAVAAISQSEGAGRRVRARRYVVASLAAGTLFGGAVCLAGLVFQGPVLALLGTPDRLRDIAGSFLQVFLLTLPFYSLFIVSNAVFRALKWVRFPLYATMIVSLVNAFLDFGLGLGWFGLPRLGYPGVAWATFAAIMAGSLFNLFVLVRAGLITRAGLPPWRWARRALPYLFGVAWPSGLMQALWQAAYMVLYGVLAGLPQDAVAALAGMTAGIRIESLLFLPGFAFNMTASIIVGHELGAGRPAEAKRLGRRIWLVAVGLMTVLAAAVWPFAPQLAAFVAPDPLVAEKALGYLRYNLAGIPLTVTTMALGGVFVGAGAAMYNLLSFALAGWAVRLPLAWLLGRLVLGSAEGVWQAMFASMVFQAALMFYLFQCRNWTRFAMRSTGRQGAPNGDV